MLRRRGLIQGTQGAGGDAGWVTYLDADGATSDNVDFPNRMFINVGGTYKFVFGDIDLESLQSGNGILLSVAYSDYTSLILIGCVARFDIELIGNTIFTDATNTLPAVIKGLVISFTLHETTFDYTVRSENAPALNVAGSRSFTATNYACKRLLQYNCAAPVKLMEYVGGTRTGTLLSTSVEHRAYTALSSPIRLTSGYTYTFSLTGAVTLGALATSDLIVFLTYDGSYGIRLIYSIRNFNLYVNGASVYAKRYNSGLTVTEASVVIKVYDVCTTVQASLNNETFYTLDAYPGAEDLQVYLNNYMNGKGAFRVTCEKTQ